MFSSEYDEPSPGDRHDASRAVGVTRRPAAETTETGTFSRAGLCHWCCVNPKMKRRGAKFCGQKCRQSAWRCVRNMETRERNAKPMRFGYADPPYPGFAKKLYGDEPSYAGEDDHVELIASLTDRYDGWALSTSAAALRAVLPMCPATVRVCAWVKPIGVSSKTHGLHSTWEPLIVQPGRELMPGKRDFLYAQPARGGGDLIGRKPLKFCSFLFEALGMLPGDDLDDLFPGTGIVLRSWKEICRRANT